MFKAKSSYTFIETLGDCSIFCSLFVIRKKEAILCDFTSCSQSQNCKVSRNMPRIDM